MRRPHPIALVMVMALVMAGTAVAAGAAQDGRDLRSAVPHARVLYRDTIGDGRDRLPHVPMAGWADIRGASRAVIRTDEARRIKVTVQSRRDFPVPRRAQAGVLFVVVDLDTKGGPRPDYHFDWRPFRGSGICDFDEGIDARIDRCRLAYGRSGALVMSGRLRNLKITKTIRFRAYTAGTRTWDRAPDVGWVS